MECHIVYALLMCDLSEPLHDSKKVMGLVERMKGLVGDKRLKIQEVDKRVETSLRNRYVTPVDGKLAQAIVTV
jgi:hypothetical protein